MGRPTATKLIQADSEFLGASDIMGRGDMHCRCVKVWTYPAGHKVGGKPKEKDFTVLEIEWFRPIEKRWQPGKKRWIANQGTQKLMKIRARSVFAVDWQGVEMDLYVEVTNGADGELTWGVRPRWTPDELNKKKRRVMMREAANRLVPKSKDKPQGKEHSG